MRLRGRVGAVAVALAAGCAGPAPGDAPEAPGFARVEGAWRLAHDGVELRVEGAVTTLSLPGAATLRLRTRLADPGEPRRVGPAVVARRSGDVTEEIEDTAGGVEQRWRFARAPAGGDLTVHVDVGGLRCAGADADGLTLVEGDTPRFRYSHGTWVDRDGRRTAVPARCTDAGLALTVPAAVLARSTFPAVLDPTIVPVATAHRPVALVPRGHVNVYGLSSAFNGRVHLVAYDHLARISAAGTVLVPPRRRPGVASNDIFKPLIVRRGDGFLEIAANRTTAPGSLIAVRRDADGAPMAGPTTTLPTVPPGGGDRGAVCDAAGCLVAIAAPSGVFVTRLGPDGALLGAGYERVATPAAYEVGVGLAASGYLVAWTAMPDGATRDVRVARVARDGTVLDPGGRSLSTHALDRGSPAVASDGVNFLVAWHARAGFGARPAGAYAVLVGPTGASLTETIFLGPGDLNVPRLPSIVFDGTNYIVAWPGAATRAVRLDRAGRLLDPAPVPLGVPSVYASLSGGPGGLYLAHTLIDGSLSGRPVRNDLAAPGPSVSIVDHPPSHGAPAVVWNGRAFVLARRPQTGTVEDVGAYQFRAADGGGSEAWVPFAGTMGGTRPFVAASTGPRVVLAHIYGTLLTTGVSLAPDGAQTAVRPAYEDYPRGGASPTAVSGRGDFAVASLGIVSPGDHSTRLYFRRYDGTGQTVDPAPLALPAVDGTAAWDDTNWNLFVVTSTYRLQRRRLSPAGDLLEPAPVDLDGPVQTFTTGQGSSSVSAACGAGVCAVLFYDRSLSGHSRLRAVVAGDAGATPVLLDACASLRDCAAGSGSRLLAYDGTNFVAVYGTNSVPNGTGMPSAGGVVARRFTRTGALLDATPFALFSRDDSVRENSCALDSDRAGSTMVACLAADWHYPGVAVVRAAVFREDGLGSDAGAPDAASPDGGVDAAITDAPVAVDAPAVDAGLDASVADVVRPDFGAPTSDAGSVDAPDAPGAGTTDAGTTDAPAEDGGCDVGGAPGSRRPFAWAVALLACLLRPRRARTPARS